MAAAAVFSSIAAPAVPACVWSSTATPRHRLASWSSWPVTARCAATMELMMPPEHSAQTCALAAPVPGVGIAPRHHEHLVTLLHQKLDHAAPRGQVDDVVLVDHRGHDQQRV